MKQTGIDYVNNARTQLKGGEINAKKGCAYVNVCVTSKHPSIDENI